MDLNLVFRGEYAENAPQVGESFRLAWLCGECIERHDFIVDGRLLESRVVMRSEQEPQCKYCMRCAPLLAEDVELCDKCSVRTGALAGHCYFCPSDGYKWANKM